MEVIGAVGTIIGLIQGVLDKYESIQSLHHEIKYFRKVLNSVKGVLQDIQQQLQGPSHRRTTSLSHPLRLLNDAITEGSEILQECSRKKKLRARVFSKTYLGKLNGAAAKIKDAMQLISTAGITLQGSIQEGLEETEEKIDRLQRTIQKHNHKVANLFEQQVNAMATGMQELPEQIVRVLMDLNLVTSKIDFDGQMQEIATHADDLRREKAFVDEQILQMVLAISLMDYRSSPPVTPTVKPVPLSSSIPDVLVCPISKEVMKDPVVLNASGLTYDRESLCRSLLSHPNLCPASNVRYDSALNFTVNLGLRQVLTSIYGDDAYQPFDDTRFWAQYKALWQEKPRVNMNTLSEPSSPATTSNEELYTTVEALLCGMNREKIDMKRAEFLATAHPTDPVMIAAKSYLCLQSPNKKKVAITFAKQALHHGLASVAKSGKPLAQNEIGWLYRNGLGVDKDYSKSMEWYQKAARQGHASAQNNIGWLYQEGLGVEKDYSEAMEWYQKAASQGHASAQYNIGWLYQKGLGVDKDYYKAMEWYHMAASQGHAVAQNNIGWLYQKGLGVDKITPRQWNGTKRLPVRDMLLLSTTLDGCIRKVWVLARITPRQWNGTKRLPVRDMLLLRTTLAGCIRC